jgi:hypothetical protein
MQNEQTIDINDHELAAVNGLSVDDKEIYKKLGKEMFGHLNFKGHELVNNIKPDQYEVLAYIVQQIKDGLHISMLEEGEVEIMHKTYGATWYTEWGFVEGDLHDIVTVDKN